MKFLQQLFSFYINSSIHVALSVYALTWITLMELNLNYNTPVLYFVFYAAITGYNFVKYFGIAKFRHRRLANWLKLIQMLSLVCFLLMCFYAIQLQMITLILIGLFAVLTFLYAIPLLSKRQRTLRSISGLKIYIIALVWTGVTVFLPLIDQGFDFTTDSILLGVQRFVYIIVLMLPFEIRDLKYDSLSLITIPQKLGIQKTKGLGAMLLVIIFFLEYFKNDIELERLIPFVITMGVTMVLLFNSKINQSKYYCSFGVEALPILWLVLLFIFV
ncbi:hypothetical protein VOI54_07585 [Tamlana sp. 2201CG12-4]|uniref:hypothetical protein n=1 Tax=Tamlana sp. 2201CG12-4 TaxID=3112582 RepID=UPI002DB9C140|nr:hypothetical protein [Tamlana sp. 2201CG12-4]MEC3906876.1 hypothetical protein [Tamlana sp. 2201CG12-4]